MKRAHGLIFFALLAAGPVLAQEPVNRLEYQVPIRPASGGWYSPQTNLGGLNFDVIPSATRPVVSGYWTFIENGIPVTLFFQTDMHYSTQPESLATGLIADFTGPTFNLAGRGNYVDPQYGGGGTAVPTGRSIRMEFNSSRVGTFIGNPGQADERRFPVVATLRGAPLVAPSDYAGDWLVAARNDGAQRHFQFMGQVKLRPYRGVATYQVLNQPLFNLPPAGVAVPQAGARLYEVICPTSDPFSPCQLTFTCEPACQSGVTGTLLWMNPDEAGGFATATRQPSMTIFYDFSYPLLIAYGEGDHITIRGNREGPSLTEMQFTRIPTGVFQ